MSQHSTKAPEVMHPAASSDRPILSSGACSNKEASSISSSPSLKQQSDDLHAELRGVTHPSIHTFTRCEAAQNRYESVSQDPTKESTKSTRRQTKDFVACCPPLQKDRYLGQQQHIRFCGLGTHAATKEAGLFWHSDSDAASNW